MAKRKADPSKTGLSSPDFEGQGLIKEKQSIGKQEEKRKKD
ncbi:YuzL family protein [Metabacillus malikii]|uniref:YuzL family protein n=1 Tax=Metabacillus malikii TaxID=1504265 RepID=A0ABT9Z9B8_9BACI|nr:YuzL family protein [Metabacillus malikii]MDQ0228848.1 hypothetical protein [Metabacillus malikii]